MTEKTKLPQTLIIGAGLAGICLARRLWEEGHEFKIIDSGVNVGSRIAAGIINPIVFRRMTKSWRIDELLPAARDFYKQLSEEWNQELYVPIPIRRAFSHQQEQDLWLKKQDEEGFRPYMKPLAEEDMQNQSVKNTFGTGKVLQSAFVRTGQFMDGAKKWLLENDLLIEEVFEHSKLNPETAVYKGEIYSEIIFCEGYQGIYNPWFSYLPLEATKGEILTVKSDELPENESINRKCFILPLGEQKFKIGATYAWRSPNVDLTQEAKEELLSQADSLTDARFEIISHEAGVRPTVLDRRPLVGSHPVYGKLKIFNGLGAKGYLIAPLLSQEFVAHLRRNFPLEREISIERYEKSVPKE